MAVYLAFSCCFVFLCSSHPSVTPPRWGGVLPIMAYTGTAPPENGSFFRPRVYDRVGILLVEEYEGRGVCHLGLWRGPKGRTD